MHFLAKIHVSVGNFLKHYEYFFTPKNLKYCQIFLMFFTQKMIKNLIFNKTKNTSVRFFIYMSFHCI